ncbi:MAG: hypothetical protein Q7T25_11965 [Sideroxyarcus sp.]|nr:hypothetical protein [Sideroxyarcus sp.]
MAGPFYARAAAPTPGSGTYRGLYAVSTTWAVGDIVVPTLAYGTAAAKGFIYRCTTAGTGSGTEPTWVYTTPGTSTTTDGAVWTVQLPTTWAYATPRPDYVGNNKLAAGEKLFAQNVSYPLTANTTITLPGTVASPCILISTADTTNEPPTTVDYGAYFDASAQTGAIDVKINGKFLAFGFKLAPCSSTGLGRIFVGDTDESMCDLEECVFEIPNTHASARIYIGQIGGNVRIRTKRCTFKLGDNASQTVQPNGFWESYQDICNITTTQPTAYFTPGSIGPAIMRMDGANLSAITSTLFAGTLAYSADITLYGCRLGTGVAITATIAGPGHAEIFVFDCSAGNVHYEMAHYSYWGNTTISTGIYLNTTDGASYDIADNKHSWRVQSINGTYQTPYVTPWIDVYNEATSAVTPRLEVVRDGVSTAYNNDEVWPEFSYKGTSGYPITSIVSGRRGLVASAAANSNSSLGDTQWTGESTSPASWYGKLEPTSTITPAEKGHIRARVCVAGANVVHVTPKILGI